MAQNPLLGKRISLISKKNIRYEGLLYSINEQNATVALQNVRSYGTEGREVNDPETEFVAPAEQVHPFLLFRGQDIKDLHVHENQDAPAVVEAAAVPDPPPLAPESAVAPVAPKPKPPQQPATSTTTGTTGATTNSNNTINNNINRRPRNNNNNKPGAAIGTGASLLNRRARGVVDDHNSAARDNQTDFDFQSHNQQFDKKDTQQKDDDEAGDEPVEVGVGAAYDKNDFFDSISCDATDKQSGLDNRLRGREERQLNTETFGAVALNNNRRRAWGRGGPGGRGRGRGGRGRGPIEGGRGRGRGRGSASGGRNNHNINPNNNRSAPGGQQARYSADDS